MIKYPASVDTSIELPTVIDNETPINGALINNIRDAILAIENELGIKPSGIYATVRARISALEITVGNILSGVITFGGDLVAPSNNSQTVIGLQGRHVSSFAPTDGYVLTWDNVDGYWKPASSGMIGTAGGDLSGTYPNPTVSKIQGTSPAAGIVTFMGSPTSANLASAITDETGTGALVFGTSPTFTTSIAIGSTPATTGDLRLSLGSSIYIRNNTNAGDIKVFHRNGAIDELVFGDRTSVTQGNIIAEIPTGQVFRVQSQIADNFIFSATNTNVLAGMPIIGDVLQPSPYGVHGVGTQAMLNANQTVAAAIYCFNTIKTTGALTFNRNLILPAATDAAAYTKIINNTCTGVFSVVVGDGGAGTTVPLVSGSTATILFDSRGATQVGVATNAGSAIFDNGETASFGTVPATSGLINFPHDASVYARNFADSVDIAILVQDTSNDLTVGDLVNTPSARLIAATTAGFIVSSGTNSLVIDVAKTFTPGDLVLGSGSNPAAIGNLRLPSAGSINFRNNPNTGDLIGLTTNSGDDILIGNTTSIYQGNIEALIPTGQRFRVRAQAGNNWILSATNSNVLAGMPIIGDAGQPSPYGVHGVGTQAMADANQTLAAGVYVFHTIKTTGAITANRNLVLPAATDAAGYTKIINNTCTGVFSIVVGDGGAGTTIKVPNGTIAHILFDSRGATNVGSPGVIEASLAVPALDIDWSLAEVYTKTLAGGANTFTFSNTTDGEVIIVIVTGAASTLTWPTVKWAGGTPPTQTASGTDVYTFVKAGSTIYGSFVQALA